jgi:predicted nucleic acid-binding Zn ribbon protein
MRKSGESSLKQVIEEFLETYQLREKMNEVKIHDAWHRIMNEAIAKRTTRITLRDGVLVLSVNSAPLREELTYQNEKIRSMMNAELGGDYIREVIIR